MDLLNQIYQYFTKKTVSMPENMAFGIEQIIKCELIEITDFISQTKIITELDIHDVKNKLKQMESCYEKYEGLVINGREILRLTLEDGSIKNISLSYDGKYLGEYNANSMSQKWYYLSRDCIGDILRHMRK